MAENTSNPEPNLAVNSRLGMENFDAYYAGIDETALNLSFSYEGISPKEVPASEVQTRIRASTIASSVSRSEKDASVVYQEEYQRLLGMRPDDQKDYTSRRVQEEISRQYQKDMERLITQAQHQLTVLASPSSSVTSKDTEFSPDYSQAFYPTDADRYAAEANALRTRARQDIAAGVPSGGSSAEGAMLSGGGVRKGTYEDLRLRRVVRDRAMLETMEALGYDAGDFVPWKAQSLWQALKTTGWWGLEMVTLKFNVETFRYDTGPLDMKDIRKMDFNTYVASVEALKKKLVDNKASPITVMSTFTAYDPDASSLAQGSFLVLDAIPVLGYLKYGPKAARLLQKARVVRSMSTSAGAAGQVGAMDVAARLSAKALVTRNIAKTGTDAITAGMNASPFPYSRLDAASVDGLSHQTLKYLEQERMLQNYYINNALGNFETVGVLRPGELEAAEAAVIGKLPTNAEVIGRAPWGMKVRVTTPNPSKFATIEDLGTAQRRYDFWHEEYSKVSDEMSRFEDEIKHGNWDPDPEWVNRLDRNKAKAKAEMDAAHDLLVKGTRKDAVEESTIFYTKDQFSGHITGVLEGNPLWNKTLSAEGYLKTIDELLVPERTTVLAGQEKLLMSAQKMLRSAAYGLSKNQVRNVDAILTYGSDTQKTFTAAQLMQGIDVPGVGTIRITKKEEMAYYYKFRDTMDATFGLRSLEKYKELAWKGFTRQTFINIPRVSEQGADVERLDQLKVFVKDFKHGTDKEGNVILRLPPDTTKVVDVTGRGARAEVISISGSAGDLLKERIAKGKAYLVQVEKPIRIGDEGFNYMVVSPKRLRELTPDVLGYRKGYVPNIYRAPYAVRRVRPITFDGTAKLDTHETVRFFNSQNEADAWILAQTDGNKYIANSDKAWRSSDPMYAREVDDAVFTGLFEDYRGRKIPFGSEGKDTPVESAIVAMDRYLENLGWSYPLNDWREGVLARYFSAVNEYLETPNSLTSSYKAGAVNQKQAAAIDAFRGWLMDQLSIGSPAERSTARWMKYIGENMENSMFWKVIRKFPYGEEGYEAARMKFLYGPDNWNVYGKMRAAAFHVYLGAFNISQIFVQAANIGVVMSLHPLNAPSVIRRILALRFMAFVNPMDPDYEKFVRIAAKSALMKYEDFEPMIRAWHKSGWAYTTRSSADTRMAMRMLSPGGALRQDARALQKTSLMFFTEGELWSRLYGWLDAYTSMSKNYKKMGKVVDMTDMNEVVKTVREATRVSFNYTAANAAVWQKGPLSIPTQFLQVPAKFYQELLMPIVSLGKYKSNFSIAERAQMLLGQAVFFGAVGVPLAQFWKDSLFNMLTERDENGKALFPQVTDTELELYVGGMTDVLSKQLLDLSAEWVNAERQNVHPALSQRMSLANGFDLFISNFTSQDWDTSNALYVALGKSLAGATGGVLVQQLLPVVHLILGAHDTQKGANTLDADNALRHLSRMAELFKSWDNIQTARLWAAKDAILTTKGDVLLPIDPDGEDAAIIVLKKMGIDSYERLAALRMQDYLRKNNPEKEINRALRAAEQLLLEYTRDDKLRLPEEMANFNRELFLLKSSLKSEQDKQKFADEWGRILGENKTLASKSYIQMLDRWNEYDGGVLGPVPTEGGLIERRLEKAAAEEARGQQ